MLYLSWKQFNLAKVCADYLSKLFEIWLQEGIKGANCFDWMSGF